MMASGDDPKDPTLDLEASAPPAGGIQQSPTAEGVTIPLPPPPTPQIPSSEPPGPPSGKLLALDALLVALVVAFAFLVASFRASTSDVLMDLATGRLIANGEFTFGQDPFSFTTEGVRWVNHSWLYDWALYLIHGEPDQTSPARQAALIVLKALAVAALAVLLLLTGRRPGQSLWIPASLTALAVLAVSARALLQPACISYLFLALTLYLLCRPIEGRAEGGAPAGRFPYLSWWLLPALFLLWVNLDAWFLVGPLCVALFLLGESVRYFLARGEEAPGEDKRALIQLGLVLVVGLAACLVNPYHVHAFRLPNYLGASAALEAFGPRSPYRSLDLSLLDPTYYEANVGLSAAGLAYFLLLAAGIVAFALDYKRLPLARVFVFLGFALLGAFHTRAIPFFAIVAAPLASLSYLDYARSRAEAGAHSPGGPRWAVWGRSLSVLAAVVLIVATIPGWLQSVPHERRRLGWGFRLDPSLRHAAERARDWQREGRIDESTRWYSNSLEFGGYLAWFCPGQRIFLDHRLVLHAGSAGDFEKARRGLAGEDLPAKPEPGVTYNLGWVPVFDRHRIDYILVHTRINSPKEAPLAQLFSAPHDFPACFVEGQAAVFAYHKPGGAPEENFNRLAFGPEPSRAPAEGVPPPKPWQWWAAVWDPAPSQPVGTGTAYQQLIRFKWQNPLYRRHHQREGITAIAGSLVGLAGMPGGPVTNGGLFALRLNVAFTTPANPRKPSLFDQGAYLGWLLPYTNARDQGPVASLYLAVRAARRAVRESPRDPRAYQLLAEAYSLLQKETEEGRLSVRLTQVGIIRRTQILYALHMVLRLNPSLEERGYAHRQLADLYYLQKHVDLAAEHQERFLEAFRRLGPRPGQSPEEFKEAVSNLEKSVKDLNTEMRKRQDQYEVNSLNKTPLEKARIALENGLPKTALKVLREAKTEELLDPHNKALAVGGTLQVKLLFQTGELGRVREGLVPENARAFGTDVGGLPAFEWFQVRLAAALGNYDDADHHLEKLLEEPARCDAQTYEVLRRMGVVGPPPRDGKLPETRTLAALTIGHYVAQAAPVVGQPWMLQAFCPYHLVPPYMVRIPLSAPLPGRLQMASPAGKLAIDHLSREADVRTLRGWLALERGDTERAEAECRRALELSRVEIGGGEKGELNFPSRGLAGRVLELLRKGQ
jgi:tetratricopeptide (TPR) repeat protein